MHRSSARDKINIRLGGLQHLPLSAGVVFLSLSKSRTIKHSFVVRPENAPRERLDCRQSSESFRPPFSKGGAVEGAEPSSPSADCEILLSALSFCSFAKQSVLFSLRLHGQRKSVVQHCSFLGGDNTFCLQPECSTGAFSGRTVHKRFVNERRGCSVAPDWLTGIASVGVRTGGEREGRGRGRAG